MRVRDLLVQRGIALDEFRQEVERDVRYANIAIIDGIGASQYGIGMVAGRVAEVVLRDERAVFPVGAHNRRYGVAPATRYRCRDCSGGRFYLFALAAAGQVGVERALQNLHNEIERDMKLMGCRSIDKLSRENLRFR
jgi:malate/lactate dehydrogenase